MTSQAVVAHCWLPVASARSLSPAARHQEDQIGRDSLACLAYCLKMRHFHLMVMVIHLKQWQGPVA